ncbi:MAG: M48 family metalloprotease [Gemmatimonadetes bacterium]|nr:M48 family metalloprotease [Gemmatimonadota bacterium]NNM03799.1 M48 family metalloprotease [Gemmatimonadota bacterium]
MHAILRSFYLFYDIKGSSPNTSGYLMRLPAKVAFPVVLLLWLVGCAINPATGRRQFSLMSEGQEIQMGRDADPEIVASMGLYPDESLQAYVQDLGTQLAANSERPDLPWTFRVLDDPLINAFALPGGYIYVTRGILAHFESEAELAGVLGHEIGHVTARHSVSQISKQQIAQIGLGVGMILKPELQQYAGLAGASLQLLFLKFGRDDERQADELGVRYMGRVGYDPVQLSGVMGMLGRVTSEAGGGPPEWLSTHPNPANREEDIIEYAADAEVALDPAMVRREEYLPRLDGMTFGANPREGFFEGSHFFHPDMAFQFEFPDGWQTMNSKQAVQAASQEGDAVMALTLAQGATPSVALNEFLSQEGVEAGRSSDDDINGIPAASADFQANTQDGVLQGRVVFLNYGGTLLRFMGFGANDAWQNRRGAVRSSLESFRVLRDRSKLDVEPVRLRVLTVSRAMDLATLLSREGISDRADAVRLLNRLEGNPTLPAGQILKLPVGGVLPG